MTTSEMFLFVSHVSEDLSAAMQIVEELERRGVRCWIAPRDVRPGEPFDDEIANAIEDSRAMLLIFSERCNASEYIRREVTVAGESHKVVIPFRIENAEPKRGLRVRLSDLHWLDGFASREQAIDELVRTFPAADEKAFPEAAVEQARREGGPPVIAKYGAMHWVSAGRKTGQRAFRSALSVAAATNCYCGRVTDWSGGAWRYRGVACPFANPCPNCARTSSRYASANPSCASTGSRRTDANNRYNTIARTRADAEAEGYVQRMQQLSGDGRCACRNLHHGLARKRA